MCGLKFIDAAVLFVIITLHMRIAIYEANMHGAFTSYVLLVQLISLPEPICIVSHLYQIDVHKQINVLNPVDPL